MIFAFPPVGGYFGHLRFNFDMNKPEKIKIGDNLNKNINRLKIKSERRWIYGSDEKR